MSKGGRKLSSVRQYVIAGEPDDQGVILYQCSMPGCDFTRRTAKFTTSKWADHLAVDCRFASEIIKDNVRQMHKTKRVLETESHHDSEASRSSIISSKSEHSEPAFKKQRIIDRFDHCDQHRADIIVDKINRFLVGCAIAFNVTNTFFFIDMIRSLNSAAVKFIPKSDSFRRVHLPSLFKSTVEDVRKMWCSRQLPYRTIGFDGFKTEVGTHVVNVTETSGRVSAFVACIDPQGQREDGQFYADAISEQLEEGAKASQQPVESLYSGGVADNVSYNRRAFEILRKKYPKLFFFGCAAHCFDLMSEDLAKLKEFDSILSTAKAITKFVLNHKYVGAEFNRVCGENNLTLTLFPATRFAYADLTIYRVIKNSGNLEKLIDSEQWSSATASVTKKELEKFESVINEAPWRKMNTMHDMFGCVARATHHIETCGARASWVYMLCSAIVVYCDTWGAKKTTKLYFDDNVVAKVKETVLRRWMGLTGQNSVGIYRAEHILAWIVDPYTTPHSNSQLPSNWESECRSVVQMAYSDSETIDKALSEIKQILLRRGKWADVISSKQKLIQPDSNHKFDTPVDKIIWQQSKSSSCVEDWELTGKAQFPLISPIAIRLLSMAVQSADVERVCKTHKLIHTKNRNRLKNISVHMLLYCYVNLRLLNKCTDELGDFLTQCIESINSD